MSNPNFKEYAIVVNYYPPGNIGDPNEKVVPLLSENLPKERIMPRSHVNNQSGRSQGSKVGRAPSTRNNNNQKNNQNNNSGIENSNPLRQSTRSNAKKKKKGCLLCC